MNPLNEAANVKVLQQKKKKRPTINKPLYSGLKVTPAEPEKLAMLGKWAYGYSDEYGEADRFDPLYHAAKFPNRDPGALAKVLQRAGELAKQQNMEMTVSPYRWHSHPDTGELAEYSPADLAAKILERYPEGTKVPYMEDETDDLYPYFYSLSYPPEPGFLGKLFGKKPVDYSQLKHPVQEAIREQIESATVPQQASSAKTAADIPGIPDQPSLAGGSFSGESLKPMESPITPNQSPLTNFKPDPPNIKPFGGQTVIPKGMLPSNRYEYPFVVGADHEQSMQVPSYAKAQEEARGLYHQQNSRADYLNMLYDQQTGKQVDPQALAQAKSYFNQYNAPPVPQPAQMANLGQGMFAVPSQPIALGDKTPQQPVATPEPAAPPMVQPRTAPTPPVIGRDWEPIAPEEIARRKEQARIDRRRELPTMAKSPWENWTGGVPKAPPATAGVTTPTEAETPPTPPVTAGPPRGPQPTELTVPKVNVGRDPIADLAVVEAPEQQVVAPPANVEPPRGTPIQQEPPQAEPAWKTRFQKQIDFARSRGNQREVRRLERMQSKAPNTELQAQQRARRQQEMDAAVARRAGGLGEATMGQMQPVQPAMSELEQQVNDLYGSNIRPDGRPFLPSTERIAKEAIRAGQLDALKKVNPEKYWNEWMAKRGSLGKSAFGGNVSFIPGDETTYPTGRNNPIREFFSGFRIPGYTGTGESPGYLGSVGRTGVNYVKSVPRKLGQTGTGVVGPLAGGLGTLGGLALKAIPGETGSDLGNRMIEGSRKLIDAGGRDLKNVLDVSTLNSATPAAPESAVVEQLENWRRDQLADQLEAGMPAANKAYNWSKAFGNLGTTAAKWLPISIAKGQDFKRTLPQAFGLFDTMASGIEPAALTLGLSDSAATPPYKLQEAQQQLEQQRAAAVEQLLNESNSMASLLNDLGIPMGKVPPSDITPDMARALIREKLRQRDFSKAITDKLKGPAKSFGNLALKTLTQENPNRDPFATAQQTPAMAPKEVPTDKTDELMQWVGSGNQMVNAPAARAMAPKEKPSIPAMAPKEKPSIPAMAPKEKPAVPSAGGAETSWLDKLKGLGSQAWQGYRSMPSWAQYGIPAGLMGLLGLMALLRRRKEKDEEKTAAVWAVGDPKPAGSTGGLRAGSVANGGVTSYGNDALKSMDGYMNSAAKGRRVQREKMAELIEQCRQLGWSAEKTANYIYGSGKLLGAAAWSRN